MVMMVFGVLGCALFDNGNIPLSCEETGCEQKQFEIRIEPDKPNISDTLFCQIDADITENEIESVLWENQEGLLLAQGDTLILSPEIATKGDEIQCIVSLQTQPNGVQELRASTLIYNSPPNLESISLSPQPPVLNYTGLFCNYTATDLDNDEMSVTKTWTNNGSTFQDVNDDGTISPVHVVTGDSWSCRVTVGDGESSVIMDTSPMVILHELDWVDYEPQWFIMGSPETEMGRGGDEYPHDVEISYPFTIMKTEVTENIYAAVMGDIYTSECWDCGYGGISWHDAAYFANLLSILENRESCYTCQYDWQSEQIYCAYESDPFECLGYRLPTEAEWELAARNNKESPFLDGGELYDDGESCSSSQLTSGNDIKEMAWFCGNSGLSVQPVGTLSANPAGLVDIHGNLWEWTSDSYESWEQNYEKNPYYNNDDIRVLKGGSFSSIPNELRFAKRLRATSTFDEENYGFRLIRSK